MKSLAVAVTASALAAIATGFAAAAAAAPTAPTSPNQTVSELESQGYHVIVNKLGSAPLDECTVDAVRPGQTYTRTDSGVPGARNDLRTTVTSRTVYLDVRC